jgi:rare lipoprotein A
MLRRGDEAPERMETPKGLLTALRRKLGIDAPPSAPISAPAPSPSSTPGPTQTPVPTPVPAAEPAATAKPAAGGGFIVQIAAFSTERRASDAASTLGAHVSHPGKFWLMRLGPFASRTEAEAALAKAKAAGYSDARIQRAD